MGQRIPVTPDMIETLLSHRERTGTGYGALLRGRKDRPKGVSSGVMYNVARGLNKTVDGDIYQYFISLYESMDESIPLTPEMIQIMKSEAERTGLSMKQLLKRNSHAPKSLHPSHAKNLFYGEQGTIFRNELDFITRAYASVPDKKPPRQVPAINNSIEQRSSDFALNLPQDLVLHIDAEVRRLGYSNRAECIRQLIRQDLTDKPSLDVFIEEALLEPSSMDENANANIRISLKPPLLSWTEDRSQNLCMDMAEFIRRLIRLNKYN